MTLTTRDLMSRTPPSRNHTAQRLLLGTVALSLLLAPLAASAQPAVDRSAMEAKAKAAAEKRRRIEEMKKQRTKETPEEAEERVRMEKKARDAAKALKLAQAALKATSYRKNQKALDLMKRAYLLDSQNMDYSFNAAKLAEAVKDHEAEFTCLAGFMNVALREQKNLGPGTSQFKTTLLERIGQAQTRLAALRKHLSTGRVTLTTQPASCEVYFEGHMIGKGGGSIEAITGQRKVRASCPGHYDLEQHINVRVGDANSALLKPKPVPYFGYLIVNVKPKDGVTIFLDDVPIEKRLAKKATKAGKISGKGTRLDPYRLHARKWIIRFKKEGYDRWHRRITINRDRITWVDATMERMADTVETSGN